MIVTEAKVHRFAGNRLEAQLQRHLDLPGAADRVMHQAQSAGDRVKGSTRIEWRCSDDWRAIEGCVLEDEVCGNIQTGGVGKIEYVQAELCGHRLGKLRSLDHGHVRAFLPRLPEEVALTSREIGLEGVVRRDCTIQAARAKQWHREAVCI